MKEKMIKGIIPTSLLWMTLLAMTLTLSTLAEAGRGHHGHHHHGHHHYGHHHHHGGYTLIYNQPRGFYNRPYYAQPGYGYNYYPVPAPVYAPVPAPVYAYPPNVMMDINTGLGHFFFSY